VTIGYMIATDLGMESVIGESCSLQTVDAEFGVHENSRKPELDLQRWSVTHIESGFAMAFGPTKEAAIFAADARLKAKGATAFRTVVEKAMKRRAALEDRDFQFMDMDD
jgi:hypothetical protein